MSGDTLVTFLLDKSGSMQACKSATIEAFNAYLDGLKKDGEGIVFSGLQFDSMSIDTTWKSLPIAQVGGLNETNFVPRGGTPLIDAAYKTLKAVEKKVAEYTMAPKVVICIQTDGQENASTEFTWDDLNRLIKEKVALGWQFNFMGVGIDAYKQGAQMGIDVAHTVSYDMANPEANRSAFRSAAANTAAFSVGRAASTGYSAAQKQEAGDRFAGHPISQGFSNASPAPALTIASQRAQAAALVRKAPIVDDIEL